VTLPASEATAKRALLFASAVLILVCLLFTRSRAGIASGFVGLVCSGIVLVRARGAGASASRTRVANRIVVALLAISIVLALAIGIGPIVKGLEAGPLQGSADFRSAIYGATLRAGVEFLPFGSGLSTFAHVFPRFQAGEFAGYIDYAHNDYLQAFMELGLAAPVAVLLLILAYVTRMIELLRAPEGRSFTLLQLGAGAGLLPMILHSLFDFALHMPANAMWCAALAGVMFHAGDGARERVARGGDSTRPEAP
jgi:O-antigen ligase